MRSATAVPVPASRPSASAGATPWPSASNFCRNLPRPLTPPPSRALSLPKAIGWSIAFLLLGWALVSALVALWAWAAYGDVVKGLQALVTPGPLQALVGGVAQLLGFAFATWV